MKRTLSLILAALLLASSITACGKSGTKETENATSTDVVETQAAETNAPATDAPETQAPAPSYDTSLITENGAAKAHIVLSEGASADEQTAANELALHIKLVSGGAEVTVTNAAQEDSLPIVIGTPATVSELEELFPEDLAWLRTTEEFDENGKLKRWGPDGFAIRQKDGKLYIFGASAEGTLNGVYDFIEENLGVLWIKTTDDGIIYDEMPTITAVKADYREKSPFVMRYNFGSQLLAQRNKHDTETQPVGACHNVKILLTSSPSYDPNITEYWETDTSGNPLDGSASRQVNYWSELTALTIADSVISHLDAYGENYPKYYTASMEDHGFISGVYPQQTQPFEYAPGQFVAPSDEKYLSTVYFTFINRIAKRVGEKYPDVTINTLAYDWAIDAPLCEMEDNVMIWFCPFTENYLEDSFADALEEAKTSSDLSLAALEAKAYDDWNREHPNTPILIFDYYFCHYVGGWYERPIWYRLQSDFQYYAETGGLGTFSCYAYNDTSNNDYIWQSGAAERFTDAQAHAMNLLSQWIFCKMTWNPYEDVDELIDYFCEKVYGDAADEMRAYYDLVYKGWKESAEIIESEFGQYLHLGRQVMYYYYYFIEIDTSDGVFMRDALKEAITKAYEAADDRAKAFIQRPYEVFQDWERFVLE